MKEKEQVTKQPLCSEVVEQERSKVPLAQKAKGGAIKGLKYVISSLLLKPATWHWLIVHVPETWEKAEVLVKQAIAWVIDHI